MLCIDAAALTLLVLQVVEALRRIGKVEDAESLVRPAIPCEQPLHYRNKMSFSLTSQQSPGGLSTGYGFKKVQITCQVLLDLLSALSPGHTAWIGDAAVEAALM